MQHGWDLFPHTPALSPRERENGHQSQCYPMVPVAGRSTVHGEGH